jgi:hypothetical protein
VNSSKVRRLRRLLQALSGAMMEDTDALVDKNVSRLSDRELDELMRHIEGVLSLIES